MAAVNSMKAAISFKMADVSSMNLDGRHLLQDGRRV
jgi:hypothetical protein